MINEILNFAGEYRAKSIKKLMGREGSGWSATILRNGEEIGQAYDYGDGGAARIMFPSQAEEPLLTNYAKTKSTYNFEQAENFLGDLVNYELALTALAKKSKTSLMIILDKDKEFDDNGIVAVYNSFKCEDTPMNRANIIKQYGTGQFINDDIPKVAIPKKAKTNPPFNL